MVTFHVKGNYHKTKRFLEKNRKMDFISILNKYGEIGLDALYEATPKDTGKTAESWVCEIETTSFGAAIYWSNTNVNKGVNIAVILQFGHGTGSGGYVVGKDYINPAIQPIFDEIADRAWKEVVSSA